MNNFAEICWIKLVLTDCEIQPWYQAFCNNNKTPSM